MKTTLFTGLCVAIVGATVWFYIDAPHEDDERASSPPSVPGAIESRETHPAPEEVRTAPAPSSSSSKAADESAARVTARVDVPVPAQQVRLSLEEAFAAEPVNLAAQASNQAIFQGIFQRLNFAAGFAGSNFQCRGDRCRAALSFSSWDEARAVLNQMRFDPEWDAARVEYQAMRDEYSTEDAPRYIAYFRTGVRGE